MALPAIVGSGQAGSPLGLGKSHSVSFDFTDPASSRRSSKKGSSVASPSHGSTPVVSKKGVGHGRRPHAASASSMDLAKDRPLPALSHTPINFNDLYEVALKRLAYKTARQPRAFRVGDARQQLGISLEDRPPSAEQEWATGLLTAKVEDLGEDDLAEEESSAANVLLKVDANAWPRGEGGSAASKEMPSSRGSDARELTIAGQDNAQRTMSHAECAFNRFKGYPDPEIHVDDLGGALHFMGFTTITEENIAEVARQVCPVSALLFDEWEKFLAKCNVIERANMQLLFLSFDTNADGFLSESEVQEVVRARGITCTKPCVSEMFQLVDYDSDGLLDFDEYMSLALLLRDCQGFSQEDVTFLRRIYARAAGAPADSEDKDADSPQLSAEKLAQSLSVFFGVESVQRAATVSEQAIRGCRKGQTKFSFHDFVVWARYMREQEVTDARRLFNDASPRDGLVSSMEVMEIMTALGYTPSNAVMGDLSQEVGISLQEGGAGVRFEDFLAILSLLRQMDGFSRAEYTEMHGMFDQFAGPTEEMSCFELANALRQLGYCIEIEGAARLLESADCDNSGTLVFGEFLRLMRSFRQAQMGTARRVCVDLMIDKAFKIAGAAPRRDQGGAQKRFADGIKREYAAGKLDPPLPADSVKKALLTMGYSEAIADRTLFQCGPQLQKAELSFDEFLAVLAVARKVNKDVRKGYAGFSDADIETLKNLFDRFDRDHSETIEREELLPMLQYLGIGLDTKEDQARLMARFEQVREKGRALGLTVKEIGRRGDPCVPFGLFVQMVRIHLDEAGLGRSEAARKAQFPVREVAELRGVFETWSRWEATTDPDDSQSVASAYIGPLTPEDLFDRKNLLLSIRGMLRVLYSIDVRVTADMKEDLVAKIQDVSTSQVSAGNPAPALDFAGFLLVMRWMMDNNFGDINGKALNHTNDERPVSRE